MLGKNWTRDELLVVLKLYSRTPYGRIHRGNAEIIALAQSLNRTVGSVVMKMTNFASFDPVQRARNVSGLKNASRADEAMWDEFVENPERLAFESESAFENLVGVSEGLSNRGLDASLSRQLNANDRPTEVTRMSRTRLVQNFFRESVLAAYSSRCTICGIDVVELLNASHIIPWSHSVERRADPCNGLCLCVLHDRAFDRGLMTLSDSLKVVLSPVLKSRGEIHLLEAGFIDLEGKKINEPNRYSPDPKALAYHQGKIFRE